MPLNKGLNKGLSQRWGGEEEKKGEGRKRIKIIDAEISNIFHVNYVSMKILSLMTCIVKFVWVHKYSHISILHSWRTKTLSSPNVCLYVTYIIFINFAPLTRFVGHFILLFLGHCFPFQWSAKLAKRCTASFLRISPAISRLKTYKQDISILSR